MFIIFGSPRSGTTLLSTTLDLHPEIVIPDETDFIIPAGFIFDRVKDESTGRRLIRELVVSSERFAYSIGEYLTIEETAAAIDAAPWNIHAIISSVYDAMARKTGARIGGDKSPNDLLFVRILVKTGFFDSDVKMIHIIRDVRDVLHSLKQQSWCPPDIETFFPRFWSSSNVYLNDLFAELSDRYLLVHYEEMVRTPEVVFPRICAFLGVPYLESMLSHEQRGLRYRQNPSHTNIAEPFRAELAVGDQGSIPDELGQILKVQAGEAMIRFGY